MNKYNLIAIDIIDGIDNNFYVVDVNGLIGINSILMYRDIFETSLSDIFGEVVNIECSDFIKNSEQIKRKTNSKITISNEGFIYENKLKWRKAFNLPCPKINKNIKLHTNPDYPKFLKKLNHSFRGMGIELYNTNELIEEEGFLEEFIPSKTIDGYCYSVRVILIVNNIECHPLLFLNRKCCNPVIKNLKEGKLTKEEKLSYISNLCDNFDYEINNDEKLKKFVNNLKIRNK